MVTLGNVDEVCGVALKLQIYHLNFYTFKLEFVFGDFKI